MKEVQEMKEVKWPIVSSGHDLRRCRAIRTRHCNWCKSPILANEIHFAFIRKQMFIEHRINVCCACAKANIHENVKFWQQTYSALQQYLRGHKDIKRRQLLLSLRPK